MKKTLTYPGGEMSYRIHGSGQPLILLHGFGESGTIWNLQAEQLAEEAMVIIPDLPGTGDSPVPTSGPVNTLESFADLLLAMLDSEKIKSCTLLGHSMGGYIALAFAERYPERLDGFGLFHSTALADSQQRRDARTKGIRLMQEYGAGPFLAEIIPGLYSETYKRNHHTAVVKHITESCVWSTTKGLTGYYEAMMTRPDRTHILAAFERPVLMILGTHDKTVDLAETKPQTSLLRHGNLRILESVAHMGMREAPEESLDILRSFLKKTNQP